MVGRLKPRRSRRDSSIDYTGNYKFHGMNKNLASVSQLAQSSADRGS
jgi:hypothetical protein